MNIKCPSCGVNDAIISKEYGPTECQPCRGKNRAILRHEFTTKEIAGEREEYAKDILQPFQDGVLSKEYLDTYGTSGLSVTRSEVKRAKNVYKGQKGWWNLDRSKGGRTFKPEIKTID